MKKGRKKISDNKIATIVRLREEGCTYEQICEKLGCGNSTISRYTIAQPTPIPVNVPSRKKPFPAIELNNGLYTFKDDGIYRTSKIDTNVTPVLDIEGASPHVLEQIQKLLQEDKMNQELNELHVEYMNKEEAIRGKYNVKS